MLRLTLAAIAVTTAFILAPAAGAAPKMCDNHGTGPGQIYKTACAVGGGGGGSTVHYVDENGKHQNIKARDLYSNAHDN